MWPARGDDTRSRGRAFPRGAFARGAFTLMEIVIVVVVVGLLATVVLPQFSTDNKQAREAR